MCRISRRSSSGNRDPGRRLVDPFGLHGNVADQVARIGVVETALVGQLGGLAHVVQQDPGHHQIPVHLPVVRAGPLGHGRTERECSSRPPRQTWCRLLAAGIHGHPKGTRGGARATMQAIEAWQEGVTLDEKAKSSQELREALKKWGYYKPIDR